MGSYSSLTRYLRFGRLVCLILVTTESRAKPCEFRAIERLIAWGELRVGDDGDAGQGDQPWVAGWWVVCKAEPDRITSLYW